MNVKDLVNNNQQVRFVRYQQKELWYKCENGFEFPVPIADTGDASFGNEDKALLFMRWIKKHLQLVEDAKMSQGI